MSRLIVCHRRGLAVGAGLLALAFAALIGVPSTDAQAPEGYIGGAVKSANGPEAGVWVIAETDDLSTKFVKIVVTDDEGRFMLPELPTANYRVWVRGYGLVDSEKVVMKPTTEPVALTAVVAKTPLEAAQYYPGSYWLSLLEPPAENLFPGTGTESGGNGVGTSMLSQRHWLDSLKSDCNFCHQLGNWQTRDIQHVLDAKPDLKTHAQAWEYRLGTGVRGTSMYGVLNIQGQPQSLKTFSAWSEAIAKGALPPAPPRPKGIERNLVLTQWDVGSDHTFMHDLASTDKNNPTVNPGGRVYAASAGHGQLVIMDPRENFTTQLDIPTREPRDKVPSRFPAPMRPSMYFGDEHIWANPPYNPADPHNPMFDSKGRVWLTSKIRDKNPAWCSDPANKFAAWYTPRPGGRQASFYDPKTQQFTLIETCFGTHHLQFDNDANETVYFNGGGAGLAWVDTKVFDETKDEQKAVGWCPTIVDTNGDGKITKPWQELGREGELYRVENGGQDAGAGSAKLDPTKDTQINFSMYSVIPSPVDDSVWGISEAFPGYLIRMKRGNNAPSSCVTQVFKVPEPGFDPRGVDIDTNGVIWTALAGSSHMASFDARKCKDLNGPGKADGSQCAEGWKLHEVIGPKLKGTNVGADFHYYNWVDQKNIAGLGANTPLATGSNSDSLLALDPASGEWTTLRVPYPMGFFSRGMDGRIDDPNAGWKGRGLWANYGTNYIWHTEGGKGTKGKFVKFQIRPNPLAR
jgi:hypothetical protein